MQPVHVLLERLCDLGLPASADEALRGRIRAEQIGGTLRLSPLSMGANIMNAVVIVALFWPTVEHGILLLWGVPAFLISAMGLRSWIAKRRRVAPARVSRRAIKRAIVFSAVLSAIWIVALPLFFFEVDPSRQVLLSALLGGMISAGGFTLATIPAAAIAYVLIMVAGSLVQCAMSGDGIYVALATMITVYGLLIILSVMLNFRTFIDKLVSQYEREHQAEVISLLLNDFEESASDWLWETDAALCLQHVSPRFAEKLGEPREQIRGTELIELLSARMRGNNAPIDELRRERRTAPQFRKRSRLTRSIHRSHRSRRSHRHLNNVY